MYTRIFRVALKPGQGEAYTHAIEERVIPILKKFKGFRDEMVMISIDGKQAVAISYWDRQQDADAYERAAYADVYKALEPLFSGKPEVHKYQLTLSTVHAPAAMK